MTNTLKDMISEIEKMVDSYFHIEISIEGYGANGMYSGYVQAVYRRDDGSIKKPAFAGDEDAKFIKMVEEEHYGKKILTMYFRNDRKHEKIMK